MDELQALHAGTERPPGGKYAIPEGPDGEIRGSRSSPIRTRAPLDHGHCRCYFDKTHVPNFSLQRQRQKKNNAAAPPGKAGERRGVR